MASHETGLEDQIRQRFASDPLANYPAYLRALVFFDAACRDSDRLMADPRGREIARQLIRAAGSVSANFEEGYGRGTARDFAYHLKLSRGEARECKGWYWRGRRWLGESLTELRMRDADELIGMLVSVIGGVERKIPVRNR